MPPVRAIRTKTCLRRRARRIPCKVKAKVGQVREEKKATSVDEGRLSPDPSKHTARTLSVILLSRKEAEART